MFTTGDAVKTPSELIRLWMHEATRVYSDKMVESADNEVFQKLIIEMIKKQCEVGVITVVGKYHSLSDIHDIYKIV